MKKRYKLSGNIQTLYGWLVESVMVGIHAHYVSGPPGVPGIHNMTDRQLKKKVRKDLLQAIAGKKSVKNILYGLI